MADFCPCFVLYQPVCIPAVVPLQAFLYVLALLVHPGLFCLPHIFLDFLVDCPVLPWPSSGCFVQAKSVRQLEAIVAGEFQEFKTSIIRLRIAVAFACAFPVLISILSYFGILIALHNNDVLFGSLIQDFLLLVVEVFYFFITVGSCWGICLNKDDVKGGCPQTNGDNRLEIGQQPLPVQTVLVN